MSNENQSSLNALAICIVLNAALNGISKQHWELIYFNKIRVFFPNESLDDYKTGYQAALITLDFYFGFLGDFEVGGILQ
jgi:hypothetical protein